MSASLLSRQRKRRRDEAFHYAREYLGRKVLPRGLPADLREWERTWTDDKIANGWYEGELRAILERYWRRDKRRWRFV